ncbi:hypothetical protein [Leuconostoc lactis]|uniref:hypothetical protein n=1 Tax=Leuconostoc lactis TaxID=1246 RepID=UPI000E91C316|nr:hypothetical protein [Leuconostoc lactis]HBP98106.1 hypothetical protein [Leuconostoc lactis]
MDRYPNGMSRSDLIYVGEIAEPLTGRLDWLRNERSKSLDEIDQVNDYINELDDEIQRLEFGDE